MDDAAKLIDQAVGLRAASLTSEQLERRKRVEKRNEAISAGVKQPQSGVFGKVKA